MKQSLIHDNQYYSALNNIVENVIMFDYEELKISLLNWSSDQILFRWEKVVLVGWLPLAIRSKESQSRQWKTEHQVHQSADY